MSGVKKYLPHFVVFVSSMGIMIIELVASRIIAKYFGNSLYTWTGIIGIVLGGITLGNYLGGKIADRYDVRRAARTLLLTGAALVLLILVLDIGTAAAFNYLSMPENRLFLILAAALVITLMFFLPSTALGTISPIMAKYALEESEHIGTTVGGIYASGSAGSIIGTFLSGFVLVPLLGIRIVVITVAAVIALLTLLIRGKRRFLAALFAGLVLLLFFVGIAPRADVPGIDRVSGRSNVVYETDSMYSHISVKDRTSGERVLVMDGLIHNRYDPNNPDNLLYSYERMYKAATDAYLGNRIATTVNQEEQNETETATENPASKDVSPKNPASGSDATITTLTLGGGALTFPSYLERHYPESFNVVVEIDPQVIEVAHRFFDIPRDTELAVRISDARQYVRSREGRYDIIYLDVFDSYSIPSHLTTMEFARELQKHLNPNGLVLVNLIDIYSEGRFLGAYSKTMQKVFDDLRVYATPDFDHDARNTFVLAAGPGVKHLGTLGDVNGEDYELLREEELNGLQERNKSPLLTDNYAPVEILLAPVFIRALF